MEYEVKNDYMGVKPQLEVVHNALFADSNDMTRGAIFNEARTRRYMLFRIWNDKKPKATFIGLNPSTANGNKNDPTIGKIMKIAYNNGFGGLYMINLFSWIETDPNELDPDWPDPLNDSIIPFYCSKADKIVFAWGNFPEARERAEQLKKYTPIASCISKNKNGSPVHPLYQKDKSILKDYYL